MTASARPPAGGGGVTPSRMIGDGLGQISQANARRLDHEILSFRRIQALHRPDELWLPDPDADWSYESYEEAVDYVTDQHEDPETSAAAVAGITSFLVCAECRIIERQHAADRGYEYAIWPCATARCWGATE